MRSALPEEIEKICHHNLISDSTLTLPHIQRCFEDMMQEIDMLAADAPPVGSLQPLSRHGDMDDEDDEMGHLYTGFCDTRVLARTMLEEWETEPAVCDIDKGETTSKRHPRRNIKCFSTPHTARDPNKNEEVELESEDLQGLMCQPPKVGAIRFHYEPESTNTSRANVTATTLQGTTSVITSRGPYQLEGARWHLLTKNLHQP